MILELLVPLSRDPLKLHLEMHSKCPTTAWCSRMRMGLGAVVDKHQSSIQTFPICDSPGPLILQNYLRNCKNTLFAIPVWQLGVNYWPRNSCPVFGEALKMRARTRFFPSENRAKGIMCLLRLNLLVESGQRGGRPCRWIKVTKFSLNVGVLGETSSKI